ncbi:phosphatidylinositol-specific phospholipase C domain-containing protein [Bacillus thuringiensis]|uniref:1-phosphatidylinositol phosphodiesterase n=1 Tax=Bacillus thuringiensis TaxID=1428 RepID=A0A9X6TKQ1_BACTU|nr:phosphatidylinositol-specific phospholipase C domain-containing protein [Bacillus thuringiensis]PEA88271.1 hypothetical protein CON71_20575 [Bacillus thuringiensis]
MTLGNFLNDGKSKKLKNQNNQKEMVIQDLLLPVQNSKERTEDITHVIMHCISNVDNNSQDPYNVNAIYNRLRDKGLSTHYMIDREGTIFKLTNENRVAYHAKKDDMPSFPVYPKEVDQYSIGIELLGIRTQGETSDILTKEAYDSIDVSNIEWTNEQYGSLGLLLGDIYKRNPSIVRDGIFGQASNVAGRPFAYSHDSTRYTHNPNWMEGIKDTAKLSELSIPGTHDSMAYKTEVPATDHVYTQSMSLETQLDSGIRFLDMRCRYIDGSFAMHHGPYYLDAMFGDVLNIVTKFLGENPSETILMRVKQEHSEVSDQVFNETLQEYMDRYPTFFWDSKNGSIKNPILGGMRGKIVILRNVNGSDVGLNYPHNFNIQDEYKLDSNWSLYDKWLKVKNHLNNAKQAYPNGSGEAYINYLNGSTGKLPVYPYFVASGHSSPGTWAPRLSTGLTTPGWAHSYPDFPRTTCFLGICTISFEGTNILATDYITKNKLKYAGIVVSDFPGPDLINAVIKVNNHLLGSEVPGDVYQIVTSLNDTSVVDLNRSDNEVTLWSDNGEDNQKWKFVYDEKEGKYLIESMTEENLLLAWNGSHYPRKVVVKQKPAYKPYPDECYWTLRSLGGDYYEIINKGQRVYPGDYMPLWLDVDHSGTTNGTKITVHESNSTKAQKFKLRRV